jgi:hypothetical protein
MNALLRKFGVFGLWLAFGASICASMGCGCTPRQPLLQRPGWIIQK